jgi:hypothetical protein
LVIQNIAEFNPAFGQGGTQFHRAPEPRFCLGPLSL